MSESFMHQTSLSSKGMTDLQIAEALWNILDNIDTASDIYKPEQTGFYKYVMNEAYKRHYLLKTDGYNLERNDA